MTEKRYKFNQEYFQSTILDNGSPMHPNVIANRLNEYEETIDALHEENKKLKELLLQFYTEDEIFAELI